MAGTLTPALSRDAGEGGAQRRVRDRAKDRQIGARCSTASGAIRTSPS